MPRRDRRPDLRPDWRDPNMPVTRDYLMQDGSKMTSVDPEYERRFREFCMQINKHPDYRNDPTYNMRKKK